MKVKKVVYRVLFLVVVACATNFGLWFYNTKTVNNILDKLKIECRANDVDFSYKDLSFDTCLFYKVSGTILSPSFKSRDKSAIDLSLGDINFRLEPYSHRLVLNWDTLRFSGASSRAMSADEILQDPEEKFAFSITGSQYLELNLKKSLSSFANDNILNTWKEYMNSIEYTSHTAELSYFSPPLGNFIHSIGKNLLAGIYNESDANYTKNTIRIERILGNTPISYQERNCNHIQNYVLTYNKNTTKISFHHTKMMLIYLSLFQINMPQMDQLEKVWK